VEVVGVGGDCAGGGCGVGKVCAREGSAGEGSAGEGNAGEGNAGDGSADEYCCVGACCPFGESSCSGKDPVVEGVGRGQSSTAVDASETTDAGVPGTLDPPAASTERFDPAGTSKQNPGP
jgi:hypothetical protein